MKSGRPEPSLLTLNFSLLAPNFVALAAAVLLILGFAGLASQLGSEPVRAVDRAVRESVLASGPDGLRLAWGAVSLLGAGGWLVLVAILAAVGFLRRGRVSDGAFILVNLGGLWSLMSLLKELTARPRPPLLVDEAGASPLAELVLSSWDPASFSFPSGHSALSAAVYGYLAAVAGGRQRGWVVAFASGVVVAVGASRVALGAHWPSDVLGGWLLSGCWLAALLAVRGLLHVLPWTRSL